MLCAKYVYCNSSFLCTFITVRITGKGSEVTFP